MDGVREKPIKPSLYINKYKKFSFSVDISYLIIIFINQILSTTYATPCLFHI